ncbi:four helix bundle protein [Aquimarina sp. MAR_2010_214]|uniref:four helix bundle protein n=1 Tax=Aquimarina sp. MAR_2010_214 TaxID=1250026 RepID=UPI000C70BDDD|nr:four helix bundle protein [Aquimarina sp. MAR_2010_214]PKV51160.1 four helix bundle protein [Aquimarina sp. MAR_2010_214]
MNQFENLNVWKKSMDLVCEVYKLMKLLPDNERYGLISQIKRCSVSIPSNIAEGAGRNSSKEFIHFLSIANGSTCELETQLLLTVKLDFINKDQIDVLLNSCREIRNMNYSLQRSVKQS